MQIWSLLKCNKKVYTIFRDHNMTVTMSLLAYPSEKELYRNKYTSETMHSAYYYGLSNTTN